MAYPNSNPAQQAAMGNMAGMSLIAGGTGLLVSGILAGLDSIIERQRARAHGDALSAAVSHGQEMEDLARTAVYMVAELEAEVLSLRQACQQRQDVIVALAGRA